MSRATETSVAETAEQGGKPLYGKRGVKIALFHRLARNRFERSGSAQSPKIGILPGHVGAYPINPFCRRGSATALPHVSAEKVFQTLRSPTPIIRGVSPGIFRPSSSRDNPTRLLW